MLRTQAQARLDLAVGEDADDGRRRDGGNAVERKAVFRVRREIAAMPASLVVQLAIWPDEIAAWARGEDTHESLVYNMLARRKPYRRVRERLAERLEVPTAVLAHLVDARRPLPYARRDAVGLADATAGATATGGGGAPPIDWAAPPYPPYRDGTNPIERRAVRVVERDVASMPASAVVGLALWPETLADWSRGQRFKASVVWATLSGAPSERIRSELARRLDVTLRDLDDLVSATRPTPRAFRVEAPEEDEPLGRDRDEPAAGTPTTDVGPRRERSGRGPEGRESPGQMSLDL